ncbi:DNA polymerase III subunit alpha [Candidatus Ichthyocystis hellenicum]|uniref:DNA polymerase III subunit alpha n=1 Tax=Candidatus Ichthyocystis hellenicum TaxID=1561003 RepID=UPI000A478673|nr:DNA polymerase III subunit alpha [Candidatus Ichthyocystis hellenicum]
MDKKQHNHHPVCSFVHLRVRSEFSITDSIIRIKHLLEHVANQKMPAVALSDRSNIFGFIKFYKEALRIGVKPILGVDILTTGLINHQESRLLILAKNIDGYLKICELLSSSYQKKENSAEASVEASWLTKENCRDLIALSGYDKGEIGQLLLRQQEKKALSVLEHYKDVFENRFYLEIQRHNPRYEDLLSATVKISQATNTPLVATHPVQFLRKSDFDAHEAKVCIANGWTLNHPNRPKEFKPTQHFISEKEANNIFHPYTDALSNTVEIAKQCNLSLELGVPKLPNFPLPENLTLTEYLEQLVHDKSSQLLSLLPEETRKVHKQRLEYELHVIDEMGFSGYFLIVQDFINWAKNNDIPVGPGRGSGAGSIVAYYLGITELDPIKYDLLFERFLNPERISMPDFDIDFCQEKRQQVIDYVKNKYGNDAVSQIATFGTMAAKASIRDIGRVLNLPYPFVDGIAKLIPFEPTKNITIDIACKMEPSLKERIENEEDVRQCISLAKEIEGLVRNVSTHAGGVLIAPDRLVNFCPLFKPDNSSDMLSQYDKDDVEEVGLVKFDFLGLKTLTIINWTVKFIQALFPDQKDLELRNIDFNEAETYDLLCEGNTTGVFQLESRGMKDLLKKLRPNNFEDVIAVLALYRPGPLGSGMVDDFINRKHGKASVNYYHPCLESVLKPTYGIIVYQEQVMLISRIIAGYSLGGADLLRRAMGKKKTEEMAKHREIFISGAQKNNYDQQLAIHLFNLMEKFAEYGFNKSHSAAYAVIAYQTAWLKKHYTSCFMAASLSLDMDDTDKIKILYEDALKNNITVCSPDINQSDHKFTPVSEKTIFYGLGAIKGVGQNTALEIIHRRQTGQFLSFADFCNRIDLNIVNKRSIEFLVKGGAFDKLNPNRKMLFEDIKEKMKQVLQKRTLDTNQVSLFDMDQPEPDADEKIETPSPEWPLLRKLSEEKSAVGFFLSSHPFQAFADESRQITRLSLREVLRCNPDNSLTIISGVIGKVRKTGKAYCTVISDGQDEVEVTVFSDNFEKNRQLFKPDNLLFFEGKLSFDNYHKTNRFIANRIMSLEQLREEKASQLILYIQPSSPIADICTLIKEHAAPQNSVSVAFHYVNNNISCYIKTGQKWKIKISNEFLESCQQLLAYSKKPYHIKY